MFVLTFILLVSFFFKKFYLLVLLSYLSHLLYILLIVYSSYIHLFFVFEVLLFCKSLTPIKEACLLINITNEFPNKYRDIHTVSGLV